MKITHRQLRMLVNQELLLYEATMIDRDISSTIHQSIADSLFWEMPHREDNVDLVDKATWSTPAIETLMDALNNTAIDLGTDLYFILSVTDNELYTLSEDDEFGGYPNNWMMRGQYRGPEKGKHIIWLEFRPVADDYDMSALNAKELVRIISRTINHELVHYNQLKKQAVSKNISEEEAWEELMEDPKQLTKSSNYGDYISLHNEIDAFAHEAAEQLLDMYSPEQALDLLKRGDSDLEGIVGEYRKHLKRDSKEFKKFLSVVYSNIENMKEY